MVPRNKVPVCGLQFSLPNQIQAVIAMSVFPKFTKPHHRSVYFLSFDKLRNYHEIIPFFNLNHLRKLLQIHAVVNTEIC